MKGFTWSIFPYVAEVLSSHLWFGKISLWPLYSLAQHGGYPLPLHVNALLYTCSYFKWQHCPSSSHSILGFSTALCLPVSCRGFLTIPSSVVSFSFLFPSLSCCPTSFSNYCLHPGGWQYAFSWGDGGILNWLTYNNHRRKKKKGGFPSPVSKELLPDTHGTQKSLTAETHTQALRLRTWKGLYIPSNKRSKVRPALCLEGEKKTERKGAEGQRCAQVPCRYVAFVASVAGWVTR